MDNKISRREFLQASAAGIGLFVMPDINVLLPRPENLSLSSRFFENIETFSIDASISEIKRQFIDVADTFSPELESFEFNPGGESLKFNKETWGQSIDSALDMLKRTKVVHDKLPDNPHARKLLANHFYEVGSGIWAVLRVKELYENDRPGFLNALQNPSFDLKNPTDAFLGEEIYTIDANWVNIWSQGNKLDRRSLVYDLFSTSGRTYSWVVNTDLLANDKKNLAYLYPDPEKPQRPKLMEIILQKEDSLLKTDIQEMLKRYRLDRIGPNLFISAMENNFRFGVRHSGTRQVEVSIDENPSHESFLQHPQSYKSYILHECGGHGVKGLIPYQSDDAVTASQFGRIDKALGHFRPYRSLKAYFRPEGTYLLKEWRNFSLDETEQSLKNLNEATITEYAAREYSALIKYPINYLLKELFFLQKYVQERADNELPIYRFLPKISSGQIQSYWKELSSNIEANSHQLTPFEREIYIAVLNHVQLFDAPERSVKPDIRQDPYRYAKEFVIPIVLAHLIWNDKGRLEALTANLFSDQKDQQRARHLLRRSKMEIGKCRNSADNELFAEVVQFALRRKDAGIIDSMPEEHWQEAENLFNDIVTSLIDNGLAKLPPTNHPIT